PHVAEPAAVAGAVGIGGRRQAEALLAQPHRGVAREVDLHDGVAALVDPRVHHPPDGLARRLLDGVPQVGRDGVPVGVGAEVQSGRNASVAFISMNVAKASLSQMPSHHPIVTRLPNHMWAISWLMTSVTLSSSGWVDFDGSTVSSTSRNVTQPVFSIAPKAKSG